MRGSREDDIMIESNCKIISLLLEIDWDPKKYWFNGHPRDVWFEEVKRKLMTIVEEVEVSRL